MTKVFAILFTIFLPFTFLKAADNPLENTRTAHLTPVSREEERLRQEYSPLGFHTRAILRSVFGRAWVGEERPSLIGMEKHRNALVQQVGDEAYIYQQVYGYCSDMIVSIGFKGDFPFKKIPALTGQIEDLYGAIVGTERNFHCSCHFKIDQHNHMSVTGDVTESNFSLILFYAPSMATGRIVWDKDLVVENIKATLAEAYTDKIKSQPWWATMFVN